MTQTCADRPASITNGKITILLDPDFRANAMARAAEIASYFDLGPADTQKYMDAAARFCDIEERIVSQYPEFNILDFIPLTKAGNIYDGQTVLVADSKLGQKLNEQNATARLQLRLVHTYGDVNAFIANKPLKNTLLFKFDYFQNKTLTPPIFDENGNPSKVERARNTYLKDDAVTPGAVHADAKGTEYLYIGNIVMDMLHYNNGIPSEWDLEDYSDDLGKPVKSKNDIPVPTKADFAERGEHCYLRMNKKLYDLAAKCANLDAFIDAMIATYETGYSGKSGEYARWIDKLSRRDKPRKFVTKTSFLFANAAISPHWRASAPTKDHDGDMVNYEYRLTPIGATQQNEGG